MFLLQQTPLQGKTVLVRVDYDTQARIRASIPTIRYLQEAGCKVVVLQDGDVNDTIPHLKNLLLGHTITGYNQCIGRNTAEAIENNDEVVVLGNLNTYQQESENNAAFAHSLATLGDLYVQEAFSCAHLSRSSMSAVSQFIPTVMGLRFQKEIHFLQNTTDATWIFGGADFRKLRLMSKVLPTAQKVLVGGALAFPFLKAKGIPIGASKIEHGAVRTAHQLLSQYGKKIVLPVDVCASQKLAPRATGRTVQRNNIGHEETALDIGPETVELFKQHLRQAKTVLWHGPLGKCEWVNFATGTKEIGRFLGKIPARSICVGETMSDIAHKFSFTGIDLISQGSAASIEYLLGKKLPALTALQKSYNLFQKKK